ncbi:Uncharacterised protein [Mycobacteroides abscessus subsp. abscessus]|uniref:hypothetical protein n=1 Tax=Mycobacteroides abscessus TaxID=36809 RepID=UPI00092BEBA9|nr:hypothetical protein [Mycobacteroides abscessus]SHR99569.1 Uncharacterised protein [Mycobacteroides abscessus subsp. abscessus]
MPIESPTDADRLRLATDLRRRVQLVRRDGWSDYEHVWSTGEVLGVRAVLGEPGAVDAAVEVWAPTLWGIAGAEADAARDYAATRWWLSAVMPHDTAPIDLTGPTGWPLIDPGDGWAGILTDLQRDLDRIDSDLVVRQVKQKGGVLEVWAEASDPARADAVHRRILQAQEQSVRTCERCGAPGRVRQKPSGWWQALCDEHAAEAPTDDEEEDR